MDEEELRSITIGELNPYAVKVVVVDYDPRWPSWYEEAQATITAALGAGALSVEHTGSTSVPGLPAKPIIDVLLQVADTTDEASYVPALTAAGYTLRVREPDWYEHRLLKRSEPHEVNLHVFSPRYAEEEITRMLVFRDWLRTHDSDRDRYAAKKRALSTKNWKYVQDYADAKSEIVREILARATGSSL